MGVSVVNDRRLLGQDEFVLFAVVSGVISFSVARMVSVVSVRYGVRALFGAGAMKNPVLISSRYPSYPENPACPRVDAPRSMEYSFHSVDNILGIWNAYYHLYSPIENFVIHFPHGSSIF